MAITETVLPTQEILKALASTTDGLIRWAACQEVDTRIFFSDDLDDIGVAKRVCLSCPVRTRCLDAAVDRGEQYGVWGGHLFVAGRIVLSKRRKGRPPSSPRPGDVFPDVELPIRYRPLVTV